MPKIHIWVLYDIKWKSGKTLIKCDIYISTVACHAVQNRRMYNLKANVHFGKFIYMYLHVRVFSLYTYFFFCLFTAIVKKTILFCSSVRQGHRSIYLPVYDERSTCKRCPVDHNNHPRLTLFAHGGRIQ